MANDIRNATKLKFNSALTSSGDQSKLYKMLTPPNGTVELTWRAYQDIGNPPNVKVELMS